jgi:hypothetical protein
MEGFHDRLEGRIKELGLSFKCVSKMIGKPDAYVSNMIGSRNDPSGSLIILLSGALETTPNDLLGISARFQLLNGQDADDFVSEQSETLLDAVHERARINLCKMGVQPNIKDVLAWSLQNNGVVDEASQIMPYSTLFVQPGPSDHLPLAYYLGPESLATKTLHLRSTEHLNRMIEKMPKSFVTELVGAQVKLCGHEPLITVERMEMVVPDHDVDVDFNYLRVYIRMQTKSGQPVIFNYSEPIF